MPNTFYLFFFFGTGFKGQIDYWFVKTDNMNQLNSVISIKTVETKVVLMDKSFTIFFGNLSEENLDIHICSCLIPNCTKLC